MEERSGLRSAIEELSTLPKVEAAQYDLDAARIPTKPFLHVCTLILQVLDKIGPTMAVLRQDIHQNIQRLEVLCESNPTKYSNMIEILKKEDSEGSARDSTSCSRAILWLTRKLIKHKKTLKDLSMDFMVVLLQRLVKDPWQEMERAVEESYNVTLKQWHGWVSSAAFKVALKLVPDNETFITLLITNDQNWDNLREDMQTLVALLVPLLEHIHSILVRMSVSLSYFPVSSFDVRCRFLDFAGSLSTGPVEVYLRRIYGDQEGKKKQMEFGFFLTCSVLQPYLSFAANTCVNSV
ncbi:Glycolipid transfer protein 3 [Hibiscus syriacus]|uniref:Glycolipid transfer protein 3 n=1 Tax=Hibiscus syriacus TaxID=106335 RepID=A0A6A2ZRT2_HIBSY|nr:Glycolipid transfer protein 3 [Hibiscus syriacus]